MSNSNNKYAGAIGIDLGTTNCVISHITEDGNIELLTNKDNEQTTPSFIYVKSSKDKDTGKDKISYKVGSKAKQMMLTEPTNVLFSYKPEMGTSKPIKTLFGKKTFTAQHASMLMLRYLKQSAEAATNQTISQAVITVPAYFTENQKNAVNKSAEAAGLKVLGLLPEPSASAYYYTDLEENPEKLILVYDLGGGTFDASLVHISPEGDSVLAISGDRYLGGDDFDIQINNTYTNLPNLPNLKLTPEQKERTLKYSEQAKIAVCTNPQQTTTINYQEIHPQLPTVTFSYQDLVNIVTPTVNKTLNIILQLLNREDILPEDLDEILLVGGSTKLPLIKQRLEEDFASVKIIDNKLDPDLAVGMGAGVYLKNILDNKTDMFTNVTPMPIGIELNTGAMQVLIDPSTQIPCRSSRLFENTDQDSVNINLYEGYSKIARNNEKIGYLSIPLPKGTAPGDFKFNVLISINKDGILSAKMIETVSRKVRSISIIREYDSEFNEQGLKAEQNIN